MSDSKYARFRFCNWPVLFLPPLHRRVVEWKLSAEVDGGKLFSGVSRLVWGKEWEFVQHKDWLFDFIVDGLHLHGAGHLARQSATFCNLIAYLHQLETDGLVWVTTTTFKPRTNAVAGTRTEDINKTPRPRSASIRNDSPRPLRGVTMHVPWLSNPFSLDGFDFASNDYGSARPLLVQQPRDRIIEIVSPSANYDDVAREWPVFVTHLEEDKALNAKGWVPFQLSLFDKKLATIKAPHATFGRLLNIGGQEVVAQFNVTFSPGEAEIASLMPGLRSALGFVKAYPVDALLLQVGDVLERYA